MPRGVGKTRHVLRPLSRLPSKPMTQMVKIPEGAVPWRLGGVDVWLDPAGAMVVPGASLLVVSDLHLEKGSHYGMRGQFLPPYDTRATLKVVGELMDRYRPARVLSLGDMFHDGEAEHRMAAEDRRVLSGLCERADWIFVLGNHDPAPPRGFRGQALEETRIGGLFFAHEPEGDDWQVAGHLHPCAAAVRDGRRVRRSCFVSDGARIILPSMGAYTGGLNVLDEAFAPAFPEGFSVFLRGQSRLFRVPVSALRPDQDYAPGAIGLKRRA